MAVAISNIIAVPFVRLLPVFLTLFVVSCATAPFNSLHNFNQQVVSDRPDFNLIAEYAAYADAAYQTEGEIRRRYPRTVRVSVPEGTKTLYFLEISPETKTQTISVRGTKTLKDVLYDVEFQIVEDNSLDVAFHKGFESDANLIYADVKPYLKPGYRTRVTGHSLGAAVSSILLIYLQRDGYNVEKSINFGQPKFTNAAGAARYKDLPLQRIVDGYDVVPMLPPDFLRDKKHGGYAHTGEEVIVLEGPNYVHLNEHDAERVSIDEFWRDRNYASESDHSIALYIKRIKAKRDAARQVRYSQWKSGKLD